MTTVISVEHLTKQYELGVIGTGTLSRDLNKWWARWTGKPDPYTKIGKEDKNILYGQSILALDDVSFTVQQGEVLGIIGKNGAGKSTLLKILSRITAPTSGVVKVRGRIGSLLEVGTGFHPELTGRENVYLNGAILGMRKDEVEKKFDEIVDFSGVEQFIDTPVKRYSSGMYVRLAFAVAAHLEPEILIVDEVLAVGDAEFQKKCLGKMGDVASEGRTVLFVSHSMAAIDNLCDNAVLLDHGLIKIFDATDKVIQNYLNFGLKGHQKLITNHRPRWASPYIQNIEMIDSKGNVTTQVFLGNSLKFLVTFFCPKNQTIFQPNLGLVIIHSTRGSVANVNMRMTGFDFEKKHYRSGIIECELSDVKLIQGLYSVDFWLADGLRNLDAILGFLSFRVIERDIYNNGKAPSEEIGVVYLEPKWKIIELKNNLI